VTIVLLFLDYSFVGPWYSISTGRSGAFREIREKNAAAVGHTFELLYPGEIQEKF
jgi:hypothetical protein